MTNPTSNFGWQMPTSTDLVTDLPADFETFGQAVDTSMADLKGGTSGQILAKASNTDMDFTWVTNDVGDITAVTASSPLTGGGTSGAVTVGIQDASTSVKGAVQLSDSTSSTSTTLAATANAVKTTYDIANSAYSGGFSNNFYAGKNKIINSNFQVWQRGTTFNNPATESYTADRWQIQHDGTGTTRTVSQQTFTPGTAPVAGYEGQFFYRYAVSLTGSGTTFQQFFQKVEDVRTFAGQTVTLSFWAKADASRTVTLLYRTDYGTGGSTANQFNVGSVTLTTSWARYSVTYAVPSVSGLTIGANSYGQWNFRPNTNAQTIDIWGVQVEAGSEATPFQTATGTIQGELAACQRYFYQVPNGNTKVIGTAFAFSTTEADIVLTFPVQMRTTPTYSNTGGTNYFRYFRNGGTDDFDGLTLAGESTAACAWLYNNSQISGVAGQAGLFQFNNASATMSFSAEL
jgi:hypothetical protein